jgi:molybdopterin converting factor small subunit
MLTIIRRQKAIEVSVKLYATFRKFAPPRTAIGEAFTVELEKGTLAELINQLGIRSRQANIIFINGIRVTNLKHQLRPSDLVVIFPPIGGG